MSTVDETHQTEMLTVVLPIRFRGVCFGCVYLRAFRRLRCADDRILGVRISDLMVSWPVFQRDDDSLCRLMAYNYRVAPTLCNVVLCAAESHVHSTERDAVEKPDTGSWHLVRGMFGVRAINANRE